MAVRRLEKRMTYDSKGRKADMAPLVIEATRNPSTSDFAAIGTTWVNTSTATIYGLAKIASGVATWTTSPAAGVGIFASVQVTTGDLDVDAGAGTTTINSGTINFSNGAATTTMAGALTVAGVTTLNGDIDITSASEFDIIVNGGHDPAILLETDGAVTETIQIINTQGTAADAIELRGVAGDILINTTNSTDAAAIALTSNAGGIIITAVEPAIIRSSANGASAVIAEATIGGVDILASGAAAGEDINIISTGSSINVTATEADAAAIVINASGGGVDITAATNDVDISATTAGVNISSAEAAATAITLDASDAAGGITVSAGTGGILIGNQIDCTTIDVGDLAPTAARTITIGGGTVVTAAVTDTIDIAPDGATTNANSIKAVNVNTGVVAVGESLTYIATGAVTSGTHTVCIQTGAVTAGTVTANLSTGTGTKAVNVGNADALTTINLDGTTNINDDINAATQINSGTSTGAVAIGNAAAGAISADTAAGISLDAATASNFTVTGAADLTLESTLGGVDITSGLAAADAIVLNASDAAGGIDVDCGSAGFICTIANGPLTATSGTGQVDISADATANTVNVGTGAGIKAVTVGSDNTSSITSIDCGTLGLTLGTSANEHTTSIGSATTASAVAVYSGTGIASFGGNATDHTTIVGSVTGTAATTVQGGTGALNITSTAGTMNLNAGAGVISISNDAAATLVAIGTGAGVKTVTVGSTNTTSSTTIQSGDGDVDLISTNNILIAATDEISLDSATIDLNATGGAVSMTPGTATVAGVALTLNARVGVCIFTGQTTAAGADLDLDITNSFATVGVGVMATVSNIGTNDSDITVEGVNTQTVGHLIFHCINSGPAALNGNVVVTFWII